MNVVRGVLAGMFDDALANAPTLATQQRNKKRLVSPAGVTGMVVVIVLAGICDRTGKPPTQAISPDPGRAGGGLQTRTATNNYGED